jgi:hypothetical protein
MERRAVSKKRRGFNVRTSAENEIGDPVAEGPPRRGSLFPLVVLFFAFNLISAALFIAFVNRPAYDDGFNIFDVHNYAEKGVSLDTLRVQRNAPGPTSFVWMATVVRLIGGNELRDARIGALLSWLLLGIGVFLGARFSRYPELWYGSLLTLLVFPHALTAAATVLTEGPALFFAVIGALAWTGFVARANSGTGALALGILGCLFLGLAVTCRQYNLALLPAAALTAALQLRGRTWEPGRKRAVVVGTLVCLASSLVPVLLLLLVWRGIASPSMESGASYNMMYKASAGLSLTRPLVAALVVGFYLVPLTFPLMVRVKSSFRLFSLCISGLGGLAAGRCGASLLQPGPLNSFVGSAGRTLLGREVLFGFIVAVTIYNAVALGLALWEQRPFLRSSPPAAFSLLAILFFIGEQFTVGGNIPFYDRYVLQVAPFLGMMAFAILPSLGKARLIAISALSLLSHFMVWRYLFIGI